MKVPWRGGVYCGSMVGLYALPKSSTMYSFSYRHQSPDRCIAQHAASNGRSLTSTSVCRTRLLSILSTEP